MMVSVNNLLSTEENGTSSICSSGSFSVVKTLLSWLRLWSASLRQSQEDGTTGSHSEEFSPAQPGAGSTPLYFTQSPNQRRLFSRRKGVNSVSHHYNWSIGRRDWALIQGLMRNRQSLLLSSVPNLHINSWHSILFLLEGQPYLISCP